MTVIFYSSVTEYLNENLSFLEEKEAVNNLLIGIPLSLKNIENIDPLPLLLSVHNGSNIVFSCVQTPPRPLMVYGLEKSSGTAIDALIDSLIKNNISFPGLVGPQRVSTIFAKKWCAKNNIKWKIKFEQLVYRLDKIENIKYAEGNFRIAEMKDLPILEGWLYAFAKEAMGDDDRNATSTAKNKIEHGGLYVWEHGGVLVSMAAASRPTRNGITINYVYSPLEYRGAGYATSCVAKLSKMMLGKYRFCTLFTDQANPTSNSIYLKIGYNPVEEFRMIEFIG